MIHRLRDVLLPFTHVKTLGELALEEPARGGGKSIDSEVLISPPH